MSTHSSFPPSEEEYRLLIEELDRLRDHQAQQENNFQTLAKHAPIGITMSLPDRKLGFANSAFAKIIGYEWEELEELDWQKLTYEEDREKNVALYNSLLQNEVSYIEFEKRYYHKAGHLVWCKLMVAKTWNKQGNDWDIITTIVDISKDKESLLALEKSNEALAVQRDDLAEAKQKLEDSNRQLSEIQRLSPAIIYLYDLRSAKNIYTNRSIWSELGYTEKEIQALGDRLFLETIHPDELGMVLHHHQQILPKLADKKIAKLAYRMRNRNTGEYIWLQSVESAFERAEDGSVSVIIGLASNINSTKLIQQEQELHRINEELALANEELMVGQEDLLNQQQLVQSINEQLKEEHYLLEAGQEISHTSAWIWMIDSHEMVYTQEFLDIFGLEKKAVTQQNLFELFLAHTDAKDRGMVVEFFEDQKFHLGKKEIEYRIVTGKGARKWIRMIGARWLGKGELLGIVSDITPEKNNELSFRRFNEELAATNEELRVSQEELLRQQRLIRQASQKIEQQGILLSEGEKVAQVGSWILHPETRYTEYSAGFLTVHGFQKAWITEDNAFEFSLKQIHPADIEMVQETWANFRERTLPFSIEYRFIKPGGQTIWIRDTCGQKLSDGRLLGTTQDITTSKKREIELEEIQKELEQLIYSVTHDLRAPVRHIEGYSSLVLEEGPLADQQKMLLNRVIASANRLGRLIDELLEFARTRSMVLVREELKLEEIVDQIIGEYNLPGLSWKVHDLPNIQGDKKLIQRVWENLLGNAVKFTEGKADPCIEIRGEERPADWLFTVMDNGSGFDMRFSHKLFEVFQRLHPQDEFPGTGIGLAIVKRILLQHGGKIWANGVVNEGASFYFTIPK